MVGRCRIKDYLTRRKFLVLTIIVVVSESPRLSRPSSRLPLISILAAVAFVELLLNRLFVRLLHLEPMALSSRALRVLDSASLFIFELVSVLSVLILLAALVRISAYGRHYRAGARLAFPLIGGVTVALTVLGIVVRLPPPLVFHLHLSFLFLALLVVLTIASSPADWRQKLGALFVLAAFALRLAPAMAQRYSTLPHSTDPATLELLNACFFAAVAAASLCMLPRGGSRLASLVTSLAVCGAALLMRRDWDYADRVATYGFDIELPVTLWGQALVLLALGFALNTMVRLLSTPGAMRLRGWGLVLMGLGGLQLSLPYQVALAALGLLCLAEAAVRPDARALSREAFELVVRNAAAAVGAPRVVLTGSEGSEVVRLHAAAREDRPFALAVALRRRAGGIDDLEVIVGEVPPREPPFTVERRGAGRLGPRGEGDVVEVGDPAFDAAFVLRDRRDIGARLLDDATRARLQELAHGWLGVWPHAGVRYHARELTAETLPQLLALLADLARRAD